MIQNSPARIASNARRRRAPESRRPGRGEHALDRQAHRLRVVGAPFGTQRPAAGRAPTPSRGCRSSSGTARSRRSATRTRRIPGAASPRSTRPRSSIAAYGPMNATPLISPPIDAVFTMCDGVDCARRIGRKLVQPVNDAPQVDVEHPTPVVERLVLDQVERGHARVVAQHVDAARSGRASLARSGRPTPDRTRRR